MVDGGGREGQGRSRLGGGREVRGRTGLREEPVLPARRAPVPSPVQRSRRVGVLGFGPQSGSGVARGRPEPSTSAKTVPGKRRFAVPAKPLPLW